jgi:hypothetical protein
MRAHSSVTNQTYPCWDDLVAAESNGYAVVVMLRTTSYPPGKTQLLARATRPFEDKKTARTRAASLRRRVARAREDHPLTDVVHVLVEPLWPDLFRPSAVAEGR